MSLILLSMRKCALDKSSMDASFLFVKLNAVVQRENYVHDNHYVPLCLGKLGLLATKSHSSYVIMEQYDVWKPGVMYFG